MNYERIYSEFIADRLTKQPVKPAYFEKHHIVPRSVGGGDEADNIIALTPEDHFFAHLMLAKMHGGRLWAPIAFMVGGTRKDYQPTQSRITHGWATRAMAKAVSGDAAHQFDRKTHSLIHADGRHWDGLQSGIPLALGLSKSLANMLVKGSVSVAKGWSLAGIPRKTIAGAKHGMYRTEVHEFVHVDGRVFVGTQFEFSETGAVSRSAASLLARGKTSIRNGWHLRGATLPTLGRGAGWQKHKSVLPEARGS